MYLDSDYIKEPAAPIAAAAHATQITPTAPQAVPMIPSTRPAVARPLGSLFALASFPAFAPNTIPRIARTSVKYQTTGIKEPTIPKIPQTRAAMESPLEAFSIIFSS